MINEQKLSDKVDLRLAKISSEHNYDSKEVKNYASQIDKFSDYHFDVVIVDGHVRVDCLAHAVKKVKPGGILILDNSELPEYDSFFDQMKNIEVKRFSNGIQETTIFFCPKKGFLISNNYQN
jgi:predicted O-methyltransferase YrrM